MAYEIYYAFATTSTTFELLSFLVWFIFDISFAAVVILSAYPAARRKVVVTRMAVGVLVGIALLHSLCQIYPDEREQVTAYWTGLLLQLPIGWGSLYLLLKRGDTKGHSLEIWVTRYLGCVTAYGVFFWRYWNVPSNWPYVGSGWSIAVIIATMLPETVYPFVYVHVYSKENQRKPKSA